MTDRFTDRKAIKKAEKNDAVRVRQDAVTLTNLMKNMAGRQFIYRKLVGCHIFATTFAPNALIMAFQEGQRDRGLELLNDIMAHCPDQYVLMMREANDRHAATERSLSPDADRRVEGSDIDSSESDDRGAEEGGAEDSGPGEPTIGQDIYRDYERSRRQETKPVE